MIMKALFKSKRLWLAALGLVLAMHASAQKATEQKPAMTTATLSAGQTTSVATSPTATAVPVKPDAVEARKPSDTKPVESKPSIASLVADSSDTLKADSNTTPSENAIRLNFRGVPLNSVLDYLSKAAGFTIIRNTEVVGNIDVYSHRPLNKDEAVKLLNSVLNEKGYAAIRNDRFLVILKRDDAMTHDIPVRTGRDPQKIPRSDEMITQVIPVRYSDATKLLENLKPLLPSYAVANANESSNAIILTDTQTDVRRMTEIISALDTSISDISTLKVILLKYADATNTADMINKLFATNTGNSNNSRNNMRRMFGGMGMPFGGGPQQDTASSTDSAAKQAAARVLAVADSRTNAVVISAPDDLLPTIEETVRGIDVNSDIITEVKVFNLHFANSDDTAKVITNTFQPTNQASSGGGRRGQFMAAMLGGQQSQTQSQRQTQQNAVVAVSDARTNSVVVTASGDMMRQIEEVVNRLDSSSAKTQNVHVYEIKNADPTEVATFLQQMFQTTTNNTSRTTNRQTNTTNSSRNSNSNNNNNSNSSRNNNSSSSNTSRMFNN